MFSKELIFDGRSDIFKIISVERKENNVVLHVRSTQSEGRCPKCSTEGALHSYYFRKVKDLPVFGYAIIVVLRARKSNMKTGLPSTFTSICRITVYSAL